jgi:hypothetical protein
MFRDLAEKGLEKLPYVALGIFKFIMFDPSATI